MSAVEITPTGSEPLSRMLTQDGAPLTGATVRCDVRRSSDGLVLDFADSTFKAVGAVGTRYRTLTAVDAVEWPGLYQGTALDLSTIVGGVSVGTVLVVTYYTTAPSALTLDQDSLTVVNWATPTNITAGTITTVGTVNALAAGAVNAGAVATGAIDADALAADAVAEIADGVWDEILTGATHNIATSAGRRLRELSAARVLLTGTASAGTATTITLTGGSAIDHTYRFAMVTITAGTGAGQTRGILDYAGATAVATIGPAWTTTPDATSEFTVTPHAAVDIVDTGRLDAATSTTAQLSEHSSAVNGHYVGMTLVLLSGTGSPQSRVITAYAGATLTATVDPAWTTTPNTTSAYVILGTALSDVATATALAAVATDATKSRRALWNRRALTSLGVFTLYADDAVTPLATATVTDKDGAAITLATGNAARTTALT